MKPLNRLIKPLLWFLSCAFVFRLEANPVFIKTNMNVHPAIVIIGIDNSTINAAGGFPFSWGYYARFLQAIEGSRYNTAYFDIFFIDEKKDDFGLREKVLTQVNRASREALKARQNSLSVPAFNYTFDEKKTLSYWAKKSGRSVFAYPFESEPLETARIDMAKHAQSRQKLDQFKITNVIKTEYDSKKEWVTYPALPAIDITKAAAGVSFANIRKTPSKVLRTAPLVIKNKGGYYPSSALLMAMRYLGVSPKDIELKPGSYLKIRNIPKVDRAFGGSGIASDIMQEPNAERSLTLPINAEGFMCINYMAGGAWSFASHSLIDLADAPPGEFGGENDPFVNQILMIGLYYPTGIKDVWSTPVGDIAGLEVQAHILNTILMQEYLPMGDDGQECAQAQDKNKE